MSPLLYSAGLQCLDRLYVLSMLSDYGDKYRINFVQVLTMYRTSRADNAQLKNQTRWPIILSGDACSLNWVRRLERCFNLFPSMRSHP